MADRLSRRDLVLFSKKKKEPSPSRVVEGGLRAVYQHPDEVRLIEGDEVNGTRVPAQVDEDDDGS